MQTLRFTVLFIVLALVLGACAGAPASSPSAPAAPAATAGPAAPVAPAAPAATAGPAAAAAPATPAATSGPAAAAGPATPAATAGPAAPVAPGGTPALGSTPAASGAPAVQPASGPVKIGSKDFTEELLLGEMYAQALESAGIKVERKLNLAGTQVAHEALVKGDIDLYPEYTGTGYLFILGIKDNDKNPQVVYQKTADAYKQKWNLIWLAPSPMNDTNAIACTAAAAQKYNLKTLEDLSKAAPNINFAAIPDFPQRPDGLKGLQDLYGGFQFKSMTIFDPGLKYKAVQDGKADCVIAFSTDAQIVAQKLVLMEDTKGLWPPYNVAPVVRADTLAGNPQIQDVLNKLSPLITTEVIQQLNYQVDIQKKEYAAVATDFLKSKGLVK
jgi:osmoprotectant transport system substrate-binding protein